MIALAYGHALSPALVAIPLLVLELVLAAAALGVGLSAINTYYRDVRYALPFVIQLGLFANPAAGAIDGLRRILLHQSWPDPVQTGGGLAWSLLLLEGEGFLDCSWDHLPLRPRTYELWGSVRGETGYGDMIAWQAVRCFRVVGEEPGPGRSAVTHSTIDATVDLPYRWRFEKQA